MTSTREISERKQLERERLISSMEVQLGLLSEHPEDEKVLQTSPEVIVHSLTTRQDGWTAERVIEAYIRAACAAHRKTNCLTEILFEDALETARRLDQDLAATGRAEGPFWGLPSSFKDTYNIAGVDSTIGCSRHCFKPAVEEEEAGLVRLFRRGGGIPFCKTNVPQTLLSFECCNPIFGRTSNPHAAGHTCGGSTGGEAALIALNGTPMGWGSDIGGSLRIPAGYSGICGLKPVRGRWPTSGSRNSVYGFEGILAMVGPMGRTVDDLIFASKTVLTLAHEVSFKPRGEPLIPLPWRETELDIRKRLKVGWYIDDGAIKTSPACARAVLETVKKLEAAGHELVRFEPPDVPEALRIFAALTSAEGYQSLLSNLGKDPMEPSMRLVTIGPKLPHWLHWLVSWGVDTILKDHIFASIFATSRNKSVGEVWEWTHRKKLYTDAFRKLAWEDNAFDAILCPVQAVPALEHGKTEFLSPLAIGTILYNVVDSTAGVIPVTHVDRTLDQLPPNWLEGSQGSWILEKRIYQGLGKSTPAYDAEKMHGLPVGVQIVGKAWEEEKVLGIMKVVEGLVRFSDH